MRYQKTLAAVLASFIITPLVGCGGSRAEGHSLVWVDRDGTEEPLTGLAPRPYERPRLSPDGTRIVVDETAGNLWLYDLATGTEQQITNSGDDRWPLWSPDGSERHCQVDENSADRPPR